MKKKFLKMMTTVVGFCMLYGCLPPYNGDAIVVVEQEFVNSQEEPMSGIPITYQATDDDNQDHQFQFVSNENGKIIFNTFQPRNSLQLVFEGDATYAPIYTRIFNLDPKQRNYQKFYIFENSESVNLFVTFESNQPSREVRNVALTGIGNQVSSDDFSDNYGFTVLKNQTVVISYSVYNYNTQATTQASQAVSIFELDENILINF